VVFVSFGALKIAGVSSVHELIGPTLPLIDADVAVPALGIEVIVGLVLAAGILPGPPCSSSPAPGRHLPRGVGVDVGLEPPGADRGRRARVKNLVHISAALLLIGLYSRPPERAPAPDRTTALGTHRIPAPTAVRGGDCGTGRSGNHYPPDPDRATRR
jgi:hypothetical protein